MYNKITLIGSMVAEPELYYDPNGYKRLCFQIKVPPPPDDPQTYWGIVYDMRDPDWPTGDDTLQIVCRDSTLVEKYWRSLQEGDIVCVEGRLVLTPYHDHGHLMHLAEILANDIVLITRQH